MNRQIIITNQGRFRLAHARWQGNPCTLSENTVSSLLVSTFLCKHRKYIHFSPRIKQLSNGKLVKFQLGSGGFKFQLKFEKKSFNSRSKKFLLKKQTFYLMSNFQLKNWRTYNSESKGFNSKTKLSTRIFNFHVNNKINFNSKSIGSTKRQCFHLRVWVTYGLGEVRGCNGSSTARRRRATSLAWPPRGAAAMASSNVRGGG